jgi:N-acylneuraminate cytidylyltransferase
MKIVAVIHAKGQSNRVPRKNFRLINSVPLYLIQAINLSRIIPRSDIFIDSDDPEILHVSQINGFVPLKRSKEYAQNSTGGVKLLELFLKQVNCDVVIQAFPPAPFLDEKSLKVMLSSIVDQNNNSSMIVNEDSLYLWKGEVPEYSFSETGEIPNSIDLDKTKIELPTLYMVKSKQFLSSLSRTPKPCFQYKASKLMSVDIDFEEDLMFAKALASTSRVSSLFLWSQNCRVMAPPILFLDVDGTLTDGFYNSSNQVELFKSFSTLDGTAVQEIKKFGTKVCLVTASKSSKILEQRAAIIGVDLLLDVKDKISACQNYASELGYSLGESAFIGNDVNDTSVLESSGLPFCPKDAVNEVRNIAQTLDVSGGYGVCRSFVNFLKSERYETRGVLNEHA